MPVLIIILLLLATSCDDSKITVEDESHDIEPTPLLDYEEEYRHAPVWLDEERIFVPVRRTYTQNPLGGYIYDLNSGNLETLQPDLDFNCVKVTHRDWLRVTNGKLTFIYDCLDEIAFPISRYLVTWDAQTEQYEILTEYAPDSFSGRPEEFTFVTGSDQVLQETTGGGIRHKLYRVSLEAKTSTQLFPDFYRAGSPSWSPTGQQFAFAGNEGEASSSKSIFAGYQNLHNEIYYPWNLYIANDKGEIVQEALSGVRFVDTVKWSPHDQDLVAFRGQYEYKLGLWLFNLSTDTLTFLWPEGEHLKLRFDWSPDGRQMILLDCRENPDDELSPPCRPTIITLPSHLISN